MVGRQWPCSRSRGANLNSHHTHAEPGVWPLGQFAPLCSRPVLTLQLPANFPCCRRRRQFILPCAEAQALSAGHYVSPIPSLCVPSVVSNSASSRKHGSPCAIEVNWACSLCLIHSCLIRPITVGPEPVSVRGREGEKRGRVEDDGCHRCTAQSTDRVRRTRAFVLGQIPFPARLAHCLSS